MSVHKTRDMVTLWYFERDAQREKALRAKMEEFTSFNDINADEFKAAAAPLYPKIRQKVGDDIWAKVETALK